VTDLEALWRRKNDEQLLEAFAYLGEYSEEGQRVIRAEFIRRGLAEPSQKAITFQEAATVATLHRRFVGLVGAQWVSLIFILFVARLLPRDVGTLLALLCFGVFLVALIAVPMTGYKLLQRLEVESPGRLAIFMYMPLFSLLTLIGMRSFTQRWSREYGVDVDFLGPTKQALARLRGAESAVSPSDPATL
jgi:hypothetical protein